MHKYRSYSHTFIKLLKLKPQKHSVYHHVRCVCVQSLSVCAFMTFSAGVVLVTVSVSSYMTLFVRWHGRIRPDTARGIDGDTGSAPGTPRTDISDPLRTPFRNGCVCLVFWNECRAGRVDQSGIPWLLVTHLWMEVGVRLHRGLLEFSLTHLPLHLQVLAHELVSVAIRVRRW